MLKVDRIFCDLCGGDMGQLHNQPADQVDWLPNLSVPPHFTVCPVCFEYSVPVDPPVQEPL
uniref:hypothetical protein n=1 Tax=Pseudomonas sp. EL_65y_Pfl2_R95 TaxID=3088698 RepID=UPI0030D718F5